MAQGSLFPLYCSVSLLDYQPSSSSCNSSSFRSCPIFLRGSKYGRRPQMLPKARGFCIEDLISVTGSLSVRCGLCRTTLKRRRKQDPYVKVRRILECFNEDNPKVSKVLEKLGPPLELPDWFTLLEEIGKQQRWLLALEVFRWMQQQRWNHRLDSGFYAKLIAIMGKQRQLRLAVWLFSEMRRTGCRPDTSVFNAIINAHLRNRQVGKALEKALYYLDEMKQRANCQPNIVTYNILVRACAQAGLFDKVDGFLREIGKAGISPDLYTFNGIIDAFGKAGYIVQMELALQKLREEKIKPDVVTFNILIDSYGKSKDFAKMEQVFESLCKSREKPSVTTFNSMISNYGRAALLHKMEYTVEKMVAAGCQPNLVTYEVLITSYGNCREFTMMMESYNRMARADICPLLSTLNAILEVYCRCGLLAEADDWLRNARSKMGVEPAASSYTILVKAFGKAGQFDKMHHLIQRMEALGLKPNKRAFLEVLESYSELETLTTTGNRQIYNRTRMRLRG